MIEFVLKGGLIMWPIFFCSVLAVAITLYKAVQYTDVRRQLRGSPEEILNRRPGIMAPLLDIVKRNGDDRELSLAGTRQVNNLERGLGWLSLITVISPILGLTGTVTGMIDTFQVIGVEGSRVDPAGLATGIWEALITTAAGLIIAIPAHVAYHFLEEILSEIALRMKEVTLALAGETSRESNR